MKRTVLDTNIIISSALGGALVLILDQWDKGEFTVIITSDILREYFEVLNRCFQAHGARGALSRIHGADDWSLSAF